MYSPHPSQFDVTSKYNQPRTVGTTPHRGTDLGSPYGEPVQAVYNGKVFYAGSTGTGGDYEVDIALDLNGDGLVNDNAYLRYDHLSAINVSLGQTVIGGSTLIGATGNEGGVYQNAPHLHFGVMKQDSDAIGRPDYWVRNEPFYRANSVWDYAKRLDFTSYSTWVSGKTASVYAYAYDETGYQAINQGDVVILHRLHGTNAWATKTATKNANLFTADLSTIYPVNTQIDWMVRADRSSIKLSYPYYWAYHNPKYAQPEREPGNYEFDFFVNTRQ
ncbi:M23 family metallopeptidase [Dendronalium sp. ChiSLP03b]|uniref:M23 family metallopeptidase n=1 Tax=Dendronalium sp. ChiSLP03b TaxID=3075381 RepID=UPI002AD3AF0C|nr:M23 family metallopeptidase [Dendronalium sp. ChiSLP03b]MDZ8209265.1 M23 family metallopeptidase [Dendronalium sp. ChiSLP03b]